MSEYQMTHGLISVFEGSEPEESWVYDLGNSSANSEDKEELMAMKIKEGGWGIFKLDDIFYGITIFQPEPSSGWSVIYSNFVSKKHSQSKHLFSALWYNGGGHWTEVITDMIRKFDYGKEV